MKTKDSNLKNNLMVTEMLSKGKNGIIFKVKSIKNIKKNFRNWMKRQQINWKIMKKIIKSCCKKLSFYIQIKKKQGQEQSLPDRIIQEHNQNSLIWVMWVFWVHKREVKTIEIDFFRQKLSTPQVNKNKLTIYKRIQRQSKLKIFTKNIVVSLKKM
jgi:hypothetical protein